MPRYIKHILTIILLMICCCPNASSQDIEANGIFYTIISDTQVAVTSAYHDGANHYEGGIILPEKVYCDGVNYDVAAIAPRAFWQSGVTSIQIPNSVTMIGEAAFADAENLTDITLPLGLTAVSNYMLAGTAVANIVLPEGVTIIGRGAFEDCSRLHTVFLPSTLHHMGDRAFGFCVNLQEIYSDADTPPLASDNAFEGCANIHVMLGDASITRHYQDDKTWGDDDLFTLWVDEGLAIVPSMKQEDTGGNWSVLTLGNSLAYKIYGPDGYLMALTAADRYYLPVGTGSTEYLVVPTTLMRDEEDLQLVSNVEATAIEELEDETSPEITIVGIDGTIHILGDTYGLWTFIYDVYGNLWYERPAVNNSISLPGPRVYLVKVGDTVSKVFLN